MSDDTNQFNVQGHHETPLDDKGFDAYGEALCNTRQQFEDFIRDKVVLDLGAGVARLATEMELKRRADPGAYDGPRRVYSLDARYKDAQYRRRDWYKGIREALKEKLTGSAPHLHRAFAEAVRSSFPLDWKDLDQLPAGLTFDRIISRNGFPYWSDIAKDVSKPDPADPFAERRVEFGENSKEIFRQIAKRLSEGGEGIFSLSSPLADGLGALPPDYVSEFYSFFESIGLQAEVIVPKQDSEFIHVLHVTKRTSS